MESILHYLTQAILYILLMVSIFTVAIAIERLMYLNKADSGREFAKRFSLLIQESPQEAVSLAASSRGLLSELITKISKYQSEKINLEIFVEVQAGVLIAKLRKNLYYLSVVVTAAPLLGLLGTIGGMITSFNLLDIKEGQTFNITGGIAEALVATAIGLVVALVALFFHSYFSQKIDTIITELEECLTYAPLIQEAKKNET